MGLVAVARSGSRVGEQAPHYSSPTGRAGRSGGATWSGCPWVRPIHSRLWLHPPRRLPRAREVPAQAAARRRDARPARVLPDRGPVRAGGLVQVAGEAPRRCAALGRPVARVPPVAAAPHRDETAVVGTEDARPVGPAAAPGEAGRAGPERRPSRERTGTGRRDAPAGEHRTSRAPVVRKGWGSVARRGASTVRTARTAMARTPTPPRAGAGPGPVPTSSSPSEWVRTDDAGRPGPAGRLRDRRRTGRWRRPPSCRRHRQRAGLGGRPGLEPSTGADHRADGRRHRRLRAGALPGRLRGS